VTGIDTVIARRSPMRLAADRSRVITRMFVPGYEGFAEEHSRAAVVLARVLALAEDEVEAALDDVVDRFGDRHRDLADTFRRHASEIADRIDPAWPLSEVRQLLLGATFTSEYAVEGAAVCNPSAVAHPDQTGLPPGTLRFVMSFRAIGEGHRSSIGFRTGTIDAAGLPAIDPRSPLATAGTVVPVPLEAAAFRSELHRLGGDVEDADFVLYGLGERFTTAELDLRLDQVRANLATRRRGEQTIALVLGIAERTYGVCFPDDTSLAERVLWPSTSAECAGMEDVRFVRFVHDDGSVVYYGTYNAYDGTGVSQQLLETDDFRAFTSAPIVGAAAADKGMALFPRRIGGRFAALTRGDRETNSVAFSDDLRAWTSSVPCQAPIRAWEVLQLGNCGPPIETDAGWIVLTHGVGPMRSYSIGALLLDLEDPSRVLGRLREPLLRPAPDEQDGYVPNVVYSCGAMVHDGTLMLPYGIGDQAIGLATVPVSDLLAALEEQADR
jgi:predicted GH43/DUF377 family glycosyl hydrolase